MLSKRLFTLLSLVLVANLMLAGCEQEGATPSPEAQIATHTVEVVATPLVEQESDTIVETKVAVVAPEFKNPDTFVTFAEDPRTLDPAWAYGDSEERPLTNIYEGMVRYSKERKQFNRFLSSFQAISWMIADMATEVEAARLLTLQAASQKDLRQPFTRDASVAKLYASEMANRAAYNALQIHGGYGYTRHYKVERLYRDARVTTLYEGTSEVQRIVISREELRG